MKITIKRNVSTILRDILEHKKLLKNDKEKGLDNEHLYFRGESKFYDKRTPSLYLQDKLVFNGSEYYYRTLLNELGRDDYDGNTSLVRLISELQHYGAKTRMLDITKSPLIALYFAVEKDDTEPGFLYIYKSNQNEEKFDTGHTIAIKSALNLMNQNVINDFFIACEHIKDKYSDMYTELEDKSQEEILSKTNIEDNYIKNINKFMELLNQRARVREKLIYPLKIFEDLSKSHIMLPSKTTDRIRQQQGAFIFPKYTNTKDKNIELIQTEINSSIQDLSAEIATIHFNPDTKTREKKVFSCIKINGGDKKIIRFELEQLGITAGFIYPDIEHQSKSLLEK